ncbi:hypothetical protein ABBQ32_011933 [Trebouxia sp. C0010 RCD-2024]
MAQDQQQVTDALFFGNLDPRVTKRILYDICIQAGPVSSINLPETKDETRPKFGFCHFESTESAKYAHSLFQNSVTLYGRSLRVDYSPQGNPEPRTVTAANAMADAPAAPPHGSLAAAGGGFIIRRKNRNADALTSLPAVQSSEGS